MDELGNFRKLLNDIRDGESEAKNIDNQPLRIPNKRPFISKKPIEKPALKTFSPKWDNERVEYVDKNVLWIENKELSLFGLLASAVLSIVGIVSSVDYLTLVGAIGFLLSAIIIFLLVFNYAGSVKKDAPSNNDMKKKIDELSQKMEAMNFKDYSGDKFSLPDEKVQEMEGKIEELRTIVKSLIKAVESAHRR
ncbi:MAG: hypothetical protein L6420_05385 [Elusimicrobia bacterium]|nr:hypothetical protein [Elusimicrobiota bacterium]